MNDFYPSGKSLLAGVMGWPIAHSKSPRLHTYWLLENKIDGQYVPMEVNPDHIEEALRALPVLGFRGCNLTIPHKELALKIVDDLDPLAARVGAVNTVVVQEQSILLGMNTDVFGFTENLKQAGFDENEKAERALVIGAGGAARAIIVGLQEMGFKTIHVVNRTKEKAEKMVSSLDNMSAFEIYPLEEIDKAIMRTDLLVNATSLGMTGQPRLEIDLSLLPDHAWVTDAVYAPLKTDLLKQAHALNHRYVDGLGMLLHQARAGFKEWYGKDPVVTEELRQIVLEEEA